MTAWPELDRDAVFQPKAPSSAPPGSIRPRVPRRSASDPAFFVEAAKRVSFASCDADTARHQPHSHQRMFDPPHLVAGKPALPRGAGRRRTASRMAEALRSAVAMGGISFFEASFVRRATNSFSPSNRVHEASGLACYRGAAGKLSFLAVLLPTDLIRAGHNAQSVAPQMARACAHPNISSCIGWCDGEADDDGSGELGSGCLLFEDVSGVPVADPAALGSWGIRLTVMASVASALAHLSCVFARKTADIADVTPRDVVITDDGIASLRGTLALSLLSSMPPPCDVDSCLRLPSLECEAPARQALPFVSKKARTPLVRRRLPAIDEGLYFERSFISVVLGLATSQRVNLETDRALVDRCCDEGSGDAPPGGRSFVQACVGCPPTIARRIRTIVAECATGKANISASRDASMLLRHTVL
ncbi:hypothetical protein DIPPA_24211 [Diplonema papillatum]|nr:hypothetical protein DIPPA_24211 [Diplonema papillatum]KAJ9450220.1 hypothetical protein DIPPA_24211 [Diplonema papillatum]